VDGKETVGGFTNATAKMQAREPATLLATFTVVRRARAKSGEDCTAMTEVCRPIPRYLEDNSIFHHAVHVARGFLGRCWKQFAGAFRLKRRVLTRAIHRGIP